MKSGTVSAATASGAAAPTVNMSVERAEHTATLLSDGRVLIVGGSVSPVNNPDFTTHATAEIFDPKTERFTALASTMHAGRARHCAVRMDDGRVAIIGGSDWHQRLDPSRVDIFDPSTESFIAVAVNNGALMPLDRLACFKLPGDRIFIFGGLTQDLQWSPPLVLDTATWAVRTAKTIGDDPLIFTRYYSSSAVATDGRVWIVGGMDGHWRNITGGKETTSVLVFDPADETIRHAGNMLEGRVYAGVLPTDDGGVEIYGGAYWKTADENLKLTSVERMSPSGQSRKIGDLAAKGAYFTSLMLQNGKSLHVGGADYLGYTAKTQMYFDETALQGGFTGDMTVERWEYGITLLNNGRVLITGGQTATSKVTPTAEIFEPDSSLYIVAPTNEVKLGGALQLRAEGAVNVTWSATHGTISAQGLYTAPATFPQDGTVTDEVLATAGAAKARLRIVLLEP